MKKNKTLTLSIILLALLVIVFESCEKKAGFIVSGKKLVYVNSD